MSLATVNKIAAVLCHGYPNVCDVHKQEVADIVVLVPELLASLPVIDAAARAQDPNFDDLHPADQAMARNTAMTYLAGAAVEITRGVLP